MGDRLAVYRGLELGDFTRDLESRSVESSGIEFRDTLWGNNASIEESGAATRMTLKLTAVLWRNYLALTGGASETLEAFARRRLLFEAILRSNTGYLASDIYNRRAILAVIWDTVRDMAETPFDINSGATSFFVSNDTTPWAVGDLCLLVDTLDLRHEVRTVSAWTPGTFTLETDATVNFYNSGSTRIYRVHYYVPECWIDGEWTIQDQKGNAFYESQVELTFKSVAAPVFNFAATT